MDIRNLLLLFLVFSTVLGCGSALRDATEQKDEDKEPPKTYVTPKQGVYASDQYVVLTCNDGEGSGCETTFYTIDGSEPDIHSNSYVAPLTVSSNVTVKAFSVDVAGNVEPVQTLSYIIDKQASVTRATPAPGSYTSDQSITLTCDDVSGSGCVSIFYTLDGSDPDSGSTIYVEPLQISANTTIKSYSVDAAGNKESIRVFAYAIDKFAPTTFVTPQPGAYNFDQYVALTCNDGLGSGCRGIYYTTDGSQPSAASAPYVAPILVTKDTTIRLFSLDVAGNAEVVQDLTYVIDKLGPTYTVSPLNGADNVSALAPIQVKFSENVSGITTNSIRVTGVPGTVQYDADTFTATFTPTTFLQYKTTYSVIYDGTVRDSVGNQLQSNYSWSFTVGDIPVESIAPTHSNTSNVKTVANFEGDVLVVWQEQNGSAYHLYASIRDASTRRWRNPEHFSSSSARSGFAVASNGSDFSVAWLADNTVRAAISGTTAWTTTPLSTVGKTAGSPKLVSNGAGYAAVWSEGYDLAGSVYTNSSWSAPALIGYSSYQYDLVSNGSGYAVTWTAEDIDCNLTTQIRGNVFAGGSWRFARNGSGDPTLLSAPVTDVNCNVVPGYAYAPKIASNGSSYAVVWYQDGGTGATNIYSSLLSGNNDTSLSWDAPVVLNTAINASNPKIASNGLGYAVMWQGFIGGGGQHYAYASFFNYDPTSAPPTGTWTGEQIINVTNLGDAFPQAIVSNGNSYLFSWEQLDVTATQTTVVTRLNLQNANSESLHTGWAGRTNMTNPNQGAYVSGYAGDTPIVSNGTDYAMIWGQNNNGLYDVFYRRYNASGWSAQVVIDDPSVLGHISRPILIGHIDNYSAIWTQINPAVSFSQPQVFGKINY